MKKTALLIILYALGGCGGTLIKPISVTEAGNWHGGNDLKSREGYLFYAPRVVVKVERVVICTRAGSGGACDKTEIRCSVGDPFVLPDYRKPYVARFKRGFTSSESALKFVNGWLLSEASSASDNTALFDLLGTVATAADGCEPGLYAVDPPVVGDTAKGLTFTKLYALTLPDPK